MIRALPEVEGVLQLEDLWALGGVRHGFATRRGRLEEVLPEPIARLQQVHGPVAVPLPLDPAERAPFYQAELEQRPPGDSLITNQPGAAIAVAVADCLPILVVDPESRAVGAIHAGWRGLAAGVVEHAVDALQTVYDARPERLVVGLGPAIGPCCFEVGEEVIEAFAARGFGEQARVAEVGTGDRPYCNLPEVAKAVLTSTGVSPHNIADARLCTKCNSDWLWSYRSDGELAGRMLCGIALAE